VSIYHKIITNGSNLLVISSRTTTEFTFEGEELAQYDGEGVGTEGGTWFPGPPIYYKDHAFFASYNLKDTNLYSVNLLDPRLVVSVPNHFTF
jgi:hypothetical protein